MKIFEYRFSAIHLQHASRIGIIIQDALHKRGDRSVQLIFSDLKGGLRRRIADVSEVASVASNSFRQSFEPIVSYEEYASIKSMNSCRFVVFEDQGLLRIGHSSDDEYELFNVFGVFGADVSYLMIETDLFDYL